MVNKTAAIPDDHPTLATIRDARMEFVRACRIDYLRHNFPDFPSESKESLLTYYPLIFSDSVVVLRSTLSETHFILFRTADTAVRVPVTAACDKPLRNIPPLQSNDGHQYYTGDARVSATRPCVVCLDTSGRIPRAWTLRVADIPGAWVDAPLELNVQWGREPFVELLPLSADRDVVIAFAQPPIQRLPRPIEFEVLSGRAVGMQETWAPTAVTVKEAESGLLVSSWSVAEERKTRYSYTRQEYVYRGKE